MHSCKRDCIYELNTHEYHHNVLITSWEKSTEFLSWRHVSEKNMENTMDASIIDGKYVEKYEIYFSKV